MVRGQGGGSARTTSRLPNGLRRGPRWRWTPPRLYEERGRVAPCSGAACVPPLAARHRRRGAWRARYRPAPSTSTSAATSTTSRLGRSTGCSRLVTSAARASRRPSLPGRTRQSIRTAAHFDRRSGCCSMSPSNTVFRRDIPNQFVTVVCLRPAWPTARARRPWSRGRRAPRADVVRCRRRVEQLDVGRHVAGMVADVEYPAGPRPS